MSDEQDSALWSTHMAETNHDPGHFNAFAVTGNYIVQDLGQYFRESSRLLSNLGIVGQRLKSNAISTIRRLELEILRAGRVSSSFLSPIF